MNHQIYKKFKKWYVDTCIDNHIYMADDAHAIMSAWHIYRHCWSDVVAEVYLSHDAERTFKSFRNYGYHLFFGSWRITNEQNALSDKDKTEYTRIGNELNELLWKTMSQEGTIWFSVTYNSCSGNREKADLERCRHSWTLAVMAIVRYWRSMERQAGNRKSREVFRKYVMCSDDPSHEKFNSCNSDHEYLLWHLLKHDFDEKGAREWLNGELDKRRRYLTNGTLHPCISIDAYHFRHVLNIRNDLFEVDGKYVPVMEHTLLKYSQTPYDYVWLDTRKKIQKHFYRLKREHAAQVYPNYTFLSYVNFDKMCSDINEHSIALCGRDLVFFLRKNCTQDGFEERVYKVRKGKTTKTYNIKPAQPLNAEPIIMRIEPHSWRKKYINSCEHKFEEEKEIYLESIIDLWNLFKCLDCVDVDQVDDVTYKEFFKPIGDIQCAGLDFL